MDNVKNSGAEHIELPEMGDTSKGSGIAVPASSDIRLLIMMVIMYFLNYLYRNNIAAAKLAGLQADLKLRGDQYQLIGAVPSNLILNKLGKPSIYLPGCMVAWGVISCCTAATHNVAGLLVVRFLLGFVEAAYFPGCLYLLSAWYTRKELGKRTALLYAGSLISGAFSGLIAAGITSGLNGARGIAAWRWIFVIEGALTIFAALIAFFIVPDLPRTTSWLTDNEKVFAAWRLEKDIGEDDWVDNEHQSMTKGAKLAVTVMAGLGRNNIDTLLLTTPPYLIATLVVLVHAWNADRTGERYLHIALPPVAAIVAFILAMAGNNFAARYVAMCIMLGGINAGYVVSLGYISNNSASPRYIAAFSVNIALLAMTIVISTSLRIYLGGLNKQLDELEGVDLTRARENEEHGLPGRAVAEGFRFLL
ncbi:MFS transporter [Aspergillus eucalypticola CBS 122712]|uniref:MFS transporter n=1 Tax=Aspergillus eucalypticola (strain CBS 122712 / IBT 29274) TaxID=1448314 RepID=A0A317V521_ASPEC|nr:MFS transporter [Aspergillus eucalypticola CBS 122712]PWY69394.1 MFS transporter [Aspergillus eucalypticola CBS 122712]